MDKSYATLQEQISAGNKKLRFHLLGLAHTHTNKDWLPCAYTQKVYKLARMLTDLGHQVWHYGGNESDVPCDHITVIDRQKQIEVYGDYDWKSEFFKHDGRDEAYNHFAENAVAEIRQRAMPGDMLLVSMGNYQKPIADRVGGLVRVVESGVGYRGIFAKFKVFESYNWMSYVYGLIGENDGFWYDVVIPNYYDPADFPLQETKGDYFVYMGRVVRRKGLEVAVQVSKAMNKQLFIAGQGSLINPTERLHITDKHVTHLGTITDPVKRAQLLGNAQAVFVPTYYIEPFGGVAVEAMMCGTPVLTTDWGVFPETVQHGLTGYRCRTFEQFLWAADAVKALDPMTIHRYAVMNYSMDRVAMMYDEYFHMLDDLDRAGWYEPRKRDNLDWLKKYGSPPNTVGRLHKRRNCL